MLAWTILSLATANDPSAVQNGGTLYHEQSLVKPFFAGDGISIPNWDFIGNAVVTDDYIRLTPDRQTKKGAVWNFKAMPAASWEMTTEFKVSGQGQSLFGDGFALWYTKERNHLGTALGNVERFTGIGIFFDTYDNHQEDHGHPWVSAISNEGNKVYDHDEDGKSHTEGGCQSFFRNLDHPTFVRVTYWEDIKALKVQMDIKEEDQSWTDCFTLTDVHLPANYYFGASASTGDLADNHDIVSIKIGAPPAAPDDVVKLVAEKAAEAGKQIGSVEAAKQMQHHMDQAKIHSNHHERNEPDRASSSSSSSSSDEGTSWTTILLVIIVIGGAVGGGVYFATKKDVKKFDY